MYNAGLATITGSEFYGNKAGSDKYGGAILAGGKSTTTITNTKFMKNEAYMGGAIFTYSTATLTLTNTNLSSNTVTTYGGALYASGNTTIEDSEFYGNKAYKEGNNPNHGGAIYTAGASNTTIINSTFTKNSGKGAGGAIQNTGTMHIDNSAFIENEIGIWKYWDSVNKTTYTYSHGGAINNSGTMYINHSTFTENMGKYTGGAINNGGGAYLEIDNSYFERNHGPDSDNELYGGSMFLGGTAKIKNSTFTLNTAEAGGAIYSNKEYRCCRNIRYSFN